MATLTNEQVMSQLYAAYGTAGGNESQTPLVIGGLDGVKEYANTIMSKAKQKLIRDIARDMKAKFRIEGKGASQVSINPEADLDTLIEQLKKAIPNPSKNGRVFSSKLGTQKKACKTLAQIINNNFGFAKGAGIIDENADPDEICQQVAEVMYTLFTGMHGEFLGVRADAERLLKNLHHLHEILQRNYNLLMSKMSTADPENVMAETKLAREGHQAILKEMTRQQTMLENMMNVVVSPADRKLAELLKETQDYKRLVKDIKSLPGSGKFGEKLSYVLSGIGTTAQMAQAVDSALKTIQMSAAEYGRQKDLKDLEETVFDKLQAKLKGDGSEESLREYMKAARTLFRYDYKRPEIVKELGRTGSAEDQDVDGGATRIQGGLKLDKRVKRRQELRKQLVNAFNIRLGGYLDNILRSTTAMAKGTGTTVPISDDLKQFTKRLEIMPDLQKRHIYYALTGYYRDPASREERERFISHAKALLVPLEKMKNVKHAADLLKEWQGVIQLVEDFSSQFEKGFGPIDAKVSRSEWEGAKEGEGEDIEGGDDPEATPQFAVISGPQVAQLGGVLNQAKDTMRYFFRVASIRDNLKRVAPELKKYGEDYEKVLGDAVAAARDKIAENAKKDITAMKKGENPESGTNVYNGLLNEARPNPGFAPANSTERKEKEENLSKAAEFKKKFWNTKIDMLKCAEAMDLYMKHFTDGIVSHVDDIQKIETMLRGTEIISKWFSSQSGNLVCNVFDTFPGTFIGDDAKYCEIPTKYTASEKIHYYWRVQAACRLVTLTNARTNHEDERLGTEMKERYTAPAGANDYNHWTTWANASKHPMATTLATNDATNVGVPGIPYLGLPPIKEWTPNGNDDDHHAEKVLSFINKAFENMSVLKNIISAFVAIGDRFGGEELRKKIHMSPVQIYQCLINYMSVGSLTMGVHHVDNTGVIDAAKDKPATSLVDARYENAPTDGINNNTLRDVANTFKRAHNTMQFGVTGYMSAAQAGNNAPFGAANAGEPYQPLGDLAPGSQIFATYYDNAGARQNDLNQGVTRRHLYTFMRQGTEVQNGHQFYKELMKGSIGCNTDELFQMVIKAVVAKILTVIGVYNMLHKPIDRHGLGYFSGTRWTIGGGMGTPKIIPEALELYVRMPLLAEFYREIFNFGDTTNNPDPVLSMVPDMDGTFQGLVELIFDRTKHVKYGTYSENDIKTIIEEVNKIYMSASDKKNVTSSVIHEFTAEVNRRYGILVQKERKRYQDSINDRYKDRYENLRGDDRVDYAILPDEEDNYPRPGPSDSYIRATSDWDDKPHKWSLDLTQHEAYIGQLRKKITKEFDKVLIATDFNDNPDPSVVQDKLRTMSFENMLKARTEELKYAKSDKEKFLVVQQAINGLGEFSMNAQERSLILFHETVITGLQTMYGLYKMVSEFRKRVFQMRNSIYVCEVWKEQATATDRKIDNAGSSNAGAVVVTANSLEDRLGRGNAAPLDYQAIKDANQGAEDGPDVRFLSEGVPRNTNGIAIDQTVGHINDITAAGNEDWRKEYAYRFGLNQARMLSELVELLFGHCTNLDKLIEVQIEVIDHPDLNNRELDWLKKATAEGNLPKSVVISIDHSKLLELVEREFHFLKNMIDKFRGLVPKKVLDRYELYTNEQGQQEGSLYWLEKHFIHEQLMGKMQGWENRSLARTNGAIREVIEYLSKPWRLSAGTGGVGAWSDGTAANIQALNGVNSKWDQHNFYTALAALISWNQMAHLFDNTAGTGPVDTGLGRLLRKPTTSAAAPQWVTGFTAANGFAPNYDINNAYPYGIGAGNAGEHRTHFRRSILFSFNRLLAMYLYQFYDAQTEKVYVNTLNQFANGAFSDFIMSTDAIKQIDDNHAQAGNLEPTSPNITSVLFKSLALIIRNIMTGRHDNKTYKHFLETDLAEIPLYMKENYKANMPIFIKLFTFLEKKAEMLKPFVNGFSVREELQRAGANVTEKTSKTSMHLVLEQVALGCRSLVSCMQEVLEELADDPKFLETHKDSMKEYEAANGIKPLMPLSSALYHLRYISNGKHTYNTAGDDDAMPRWKMGTDPFKLAYGTRGILAADGDLSLARLPGMKEILQKHNETSENEYHVDEKSLGQHVEDTLLALRYLVNGSHYKALLTSAEDTTGHRLWAGAGAATLAAPDSTNFRLLNHLRTALDRPNNNDPNPLITVPYSLNTSITNIMQITESSNQRESRMKLVKMVQEVDDTIVRGTRSAIRVMNIIDLNLVPLNIHALMREVPLANLYNYSYTFDSMICDLFGIDPRLRTKNNIPEVIDETQYPATEQTKKVLGWMLMKPYGPISDDEYHTHFSRIVRGAVGIEGLGRPLYLGDELYNKALFGEVYADERLVDEGGPAVGHGRQYGWSGVENIAKKLMVELLLLGAANENATAAQQRILTTGSAGAADLAAINLWMAAPANTVHYANVAAHVAVNAGAVNAASAREAAIIFQINAGAAVNAAGLGGVLTNNANNAAIAAIVASQTAGTLGIRNFNAGDARLDHALSTTWEPSAGGVFNWTLAETDHLVDRVSTRQAAVAIVDQVYPRFFDGDRVRDLAALDYRVAQNGSVGHTAEAAITAQGVPALHIPGLTWFVCAVGLMVAHAINMGAVGRLEQDGIDFIVAALDKINNTAQAANNIAAIQRGAANAAVTAVFNRMITPAGSRVGFANLAYENANIRADANQISRFLSGIKSAEVLPRTVYQNNGYLTYMHKLPDGRGSLKKVNVGQYKGLLQGIGKMRFDTFYCRSLIWLTNIQRALRLKLRRDLHWYNEKIVSDNAVMASGITELYGNDTNFYTPERYRY